MKKFHLIILACLLFTNANLYAVPAIPTPIVVTQPDGTSLTICLHGDEYFHYTSTLDGFLIVKNEQDFFVYATVSQSGQIEPITLIARDENARSAADVSFLQSLNTQNDISLLRSAANTKQMQRAAARADMPAVQRYPLTGSPKALVILVNFSDKSFITSNVQTAFYNLCNQQGYSVNGATGSVKDWYKASSYEQFAPDFDVVGPFTLANNMAYYGANSGGDDVRPAQMILDACALANPTVNFATYDTDNDGYIDNVFVVYAGYNEAEGGPANTVWPHRWVVYPGYNCTGSAVFDGKTLYDYACTSELKGSSGSTMASIGTFAHEFGHVLGLPDYYYTASSTISKNTLNYWSTMDRGSYCNNSRTPPLMSAYDRFFLGWLIPEQYTGGQKTLYPLSQSDATGAGQAYLVAASTHNLNGGNPSPTEFFILEYREKTGWDTYIGNNSVSNNSDATSGMCIWHIDYSASVWDDNTVNNYSGSNQTQSSHMRVYLEPTNGLSQITPGNAFTSGSFLPELWNGTDLIEITNITKNGTTSMTFGLADMCDNSEKVTYTVISNDAYGDGWNGAQLVIKQNGVVVATLENQNLDGITNNSSTGGENNTHTISLCKCEPFEVVWTKGSYDYECSFVIKDNNNVQIFATPAGTSSNTSGVTGCEGYTANQIVFSGTATCPQTPPTVVTLPATAITQTTATLNKNITQGTETITEQGFKYKKTSESTWLTSATGSLTGLSVNTQYQFYAYTTTATYPMTTGETLTFTTQCQTYNHSESVSVCSGGSYQCPDGTILTNITDATSHTNNLLSIFNCDSVVVTNISIKPTYNHSESVSVCSGGSYQCPDGTILTNITAATSHTNNLLSVFNCDSIVVTNISITSADISVTLADGVLTANQADAQYQWHNGCVEINTPATLIEGATEQTFEPTESGYYSVEITYEDCHFYSQCTNVMVTGIDIPKNNGIVLYPNPATNELFIIDSEQFRVNKAQILDITGKTISNCKLSVSNSIDVSVLSQGVYLIKIETDKGIIIDKFIKK